MRPGPHRRTESRIASRSWATSIITSRGASKTSVRGASLVRPGVRGRRLARPAAHRRVELGRPPGARRRGSAVGPRHRCFVAPRREPGAACWVLTIVEPGSVLRGRGRRARRPTGQDARGAPAIEVSPADAGLGDAEHSVEKERVSPHRRPRSLTRSGARGSTAPTACRSVRVAVARHAPPKAMSTTIDPERRLSTSPSESGPRRAPSHFQLRPL